MKDPIINSIFLALTTANELIRIISKLAIKSSCGFNNMLMKFSKQIILHIAKPLSIIYCVFTFFGEEFSPFILNLQVLYQFLKMEI